ncbi:response regulator [Microbacterium caowuchunii]|uniref:Response regulator transcription factor n=1 Tax=Microbacterium caowuchunii TaxID=2614638 RepID=A0A5N0TH06_9MICO|nr:response regulator transcription factor [Microbacterium caowuchunii]KAA9134350.1 response regulator transcription factor [Microbacterium caowuchunii]
MSGIRVLLVDDHAMMRAGFRTILRAAGDMEVVGEAATGAEAVERARDLHPDVICMDVQMPDMDGLEATRRIAADPEASGAVLVVTTFDRDDYLFAALEAGASGFLLKNAGPEELVGAIRVLAAGDALLAPEVTRRVIARFAAGDAASARAVVPGGATRGTAPAGGSARVAGGSAGGGPAANGPAGGGISTASADAARPWPGDPGLTEREAEVLRLMADALSNGEIAARLFIGEATVKTHVSNVLQKLGARDRVQAVVLAHRHHLA